MTLSPPSSQTTLHLHASMGCYISTRTTTTISRVGVEKSRTVTPTRESVNMDAACTLLADTRDRQINNKVK